MNKLLYNNFAAYEYSKKRKTCKSAGFNVFFYSAKKFNTSCCLVYIYLKLRRSIADVSCAEKSVHYNKRGKRERDIVNLPNVHEFANLLKWFCKKHETSNQGKKKCA